MQSVENNIEKAKVALQQAVDLAIDKKKKLGEFAIINRDGKPYKILAAELVDETSNIDEI